MAIEALALALLTAQAPLIDAYTMGPGDDVFSHFGHSAICVTEPGSEPRCYNFGTANFDTPVPLTIDFIRGRALFWVSVVPLEPMLGFYRREDRTVWRQRLPLTAEQARALADRLAAAAAGPERYYRYHHYFDNCTTRIRDMVDAVIGGEMKRSAAKRPDRESFREMTRHGFAGMVWLQAASEILLGRPADRAASAWDAMFLPAELMHGFEQDLGAKPEEVHVRKGPAFGGGTRLGQIAIAALGVLLAALVMLLRPRAGRVLAGLVLGVIACLPTGLALASAFPELRWNEVVLVLVPLDLALTFLPLRAARVYLVARLAGLALAGALAVAGVLVQPLLPFLTLATLPLAACALKLRAP